MKETKGKAKKAQPPKAERLAAHREGDGGRRGGQGEEMNAQPPNPAPAPFRTLSDGVANPKQGGRGSPSKPKGD